MNYLKFGSSKNCILFLHGWGADLNSFLWLKNYFEDDYMLLFVDFVGFGLSLDDSKIRFVSDYVEDIKNLISQFDFESLVIVGHSFGGRVAIKFSFLYQNLYKNFKLVLVDSAGILPRRGLKYFIDIYRYKRDVKLKASGIFVDLEKYGSDDYKKLPPYKRQTFKNIVNEDLSKYAKLVRAQTLIVWGEKDKDTKLYMARKLKRLIKCSKLYIIKNAGHFSFLDNKEEFVFILDRFLKNN